MLKQCKHKKCQDLWMVIIIILILLVYAYYETNYGNKKLTIHQYVIF